MGVPEDPGVNAASCQARGADAALDASSSNLWLNLMGCSIAAHNYTEMSSAARFGRWSPRPVHTSRCISHGCPLIYLPDRCSWPGWRCCTMGRLCRQGQAALADALPSRPASAARSRAAAAAPAAGHWGCASTHMCPTQLLRDLAQPQHDRAGWEPGAVAPSRSRAGADPPVPPRCTPALVPAGGSLLPKPSQALQHCSIGQHTGRCPSPRPGQPHRCPSCEHRSPHLPEPIPGPAAL